MLDGLSISIYLEIQKEMSRGKGKTVDNVTVHPLEEALQNMRRMKGLKMIEKWSQSWEEEGVSEAEEKDKPLAIEIC